MRRFAERLIQATIGENGEFLTLVEKRNLMWFGYVSSSTWHSERKNEEMDTKGGGKTMLKRGQ